MKDQIINMNKFFRFQLAGWLTIFLLLPNICLNAQDEEEDDGIQTEEVDVIKSFIPRLKETRKLTSQPTVFEIDKDDIEYQYDFQDKTLPFKYESDGIKPLAMPREKVQALQSIHAKLGFGTQVTPLAEILYHSQRKSNQNFGLRGHYTSSNGSRENQNVTKAGFEGFSKWILDDANVKINASYDFNKVHYYGYNEDNTTFSKDAVERPMNHINLGGSVGNLRSPSGWHYELNGDVHAFNENAGTKDFDVKINPIIGKELWTGNEVVLDAYFQNNSINDTIKNSRTLIGLKPSYQLGLDQVTLQLGVNFENDGDDWNLMPDLKAETNILGEKITLYGGWQGFIHNNSFRSFTSENPFTSSNLNYQNSIIDKKYAGVKLGISQYVDANFELYRKEIENLPLFVNSPSDSTQFEVVYDDEAVVEGVHSGLGIKISDKTRLTAGADFKQHKLNGNESAWHVPNTTFKAGIKQKLTEHIFLTGNAYYQDDLIAWLGESRTETIDGHLDLNAGLGFTYSENLSFFVQVNNILSDKYERWNNYSVYGINALGGLKWSF